MFADPVNADTVARVVNHQADRASGSRWQGLPIERVPLAYIEFDHDVRILEWNPAAERIFGYTRCEAIGKIAMDLILPGPPSDHICDILTRIWAGDLDAHSVNENLTKDGRVIECDWFNTPILDGNGKVTGGMSFVREVSVRRYPDLNTIELTRIRDRDLERLDRLTTRQREVLRLVAKGYRTREIARELKVSTKTVEMHRAHVMDTLDVRDIPSLTRFAIRVELISAYE
jgi:PAS domain S-box-containing protein